MCHKSATSWQAAPESLQIEGARNKEKEKKKNNTKKEATKQRISYKHCLKAVSATLQDSPLISLLLQFKDISSDWS